MKIYTENDRRVKFLGDIHWNFNDLIFNMNRGLLKDTIIIQVGDFGVGFKYIEKTKSILRAINKQLVETNNTLYVFRGNHDDPSYFNGVNVLKFTNIIFVADYTIIEALNHRILCIGGAVSIDQVHRVAGKTWWRGENVFYDEMIEQAHDIDIVATHTVPLEFEPPLDMKVPILEHYGLLQPWLEDELQKERELMTEILITLKKNNPIKEWYYGHFHNTFIEEINGVKTYGLDINEYRELYDNK